MSLLAKIPLTMKVGAAAIGLGAALLWLQSFNHKKQVEQMEKEKQELIDKLEERHREGLEELQAESDSIHSLMETEIYALQDRTARLKRQIYYYETRPDIDIDFITAARIISDAEYRPGQGDGNPQ